MRHYSNNLHYLAALACTTAAGMRLFLLQGVGGSNSPTSAAAAAARRPQRTMASINSTTEDDPWQHVGDGAVNEKARVGDKTLSPTGGGRTFDAINHKAHLWHALEGLERYPHYLHRWNTGDIDALEEALEFQLEQVRSQRQSITVRRRRAQVLVDRVLQSDEPRWQALLQPDLSTWHFIENSVLDPRAVQLLLTKRRDALSAPEELLRGGTTAFVVDHDVGKLEQLISEEMYDVYSMPLLQPAFCALLRDYVQTAATLAQSDAELQWDRRPMDLDMLGLSWLTDLLFVLVVRPIARHLFRHETVQDVDWRQGYIAAYSAHPDDGKSRRALVTHTDDADVTLNICLGDETFQGGQLEFRGLRGETGEGELLDTYQPRIGKAVLHSGRHFHDVTSVTSGDRFALIVWTRSWQGVRAKMCPCCWLNRRKKNDCICGARWN